MNEPMTYWKKYGLGIVFVACFVVAIVLMTWVDWGHFLSQQHEHHQTADWFGPSGYIWQWGTDTFSNWQADFLWEGLAVLLGAYLIFAGSTQSRDTSDRIEQMALDIERRVRGEQVARPAQQRTRAQALSGGIWRSKGLAYSLIAAGLISWALMTWMGWMEFSSQQQEHGEVATLFGTSGYMWQWARLTLENWQSDIIGHAALIILPAYLLYKGSAESRESDDQVEQALKRVQQALEEQPAKEKGPEALPAGVAVETRPRS